MKRKNSSGFTLIEIIAVVVIIGIVFTIAVPAVSSYILSSRKTTYYSTASSYLETIIGEYEMRSFGDYIDDDEIMVVPTKLITLEKGDSSSSPFGDYIYEKSYIIISANEYDYNYYVNFLDSSGYGIANVKSDALSKNSIDKVDIADIADVSVYASCNENKYNLSNVIFTFNSEDYEPCDYRVYDTPSSNNECDSNDDIPVLVMCKK